jgi:long-chain acyl-CoA synthetase
MSGAAQEFAGLLEEGGRTWSPDECDAAVTAFSEILRQAGVRVLATLLDNSVAWVIADLAAARAAIVHVPLPVFFTPAQVVHALQATGTDAVLTTSAVAQQWPQAPTKACTMAGHDLTLLRLSHSPVAMPDGTTKITFTSGTTGTPKGVCLRGPAMQAVAQGLVQAMGPLQIQRHLCVLPFAILLENIAGLDAPLMNGTTCVVAPLESLGLAGSSGFDPARFHAAVLRLLPDSMILLPQMLRMWVGYLSATGQRAPQGLKFVAVGGAAVGAGLINAARAFGIPAYEGYGLSEGASVQTLNLPGADLPGSAGRALPHTQVRVTEDGEVEVAGSLFAGYLGDEQPAPAWWRSGDLGTVDAQGYLHVLGRRKNVLITSFGRNVSPEWIEGALHEAGIGVAVVFGEAQPFLSAVLWPTRADLSDAALQASVDKANATLPDYARVRHWVRATRSFDAASGMATANGRPQRAAILQTHAQALAPKHLSSTTEFS